MRLTALSPKNTFGAVSPNSGSVLFSQNIQAPTIEPRQVEVLLPRKAWCFFFFVVYRGQPQETTQKCKVWMVHKDRCWHSIAASRAKQTAHAQLFLHMVLSGINSTESKWVHDSWLKLKGLKLDLFRSPLLPKSLTSTDDRFPKLSPVIQRVCVYMCFVYKTCFFHAAWD